MTLFSQSFEKIWPLITGKKTTEAEKRIFKGIELAIFGPIWPLITGKKPTEDEMRMFKGIEDSAIANIMTSIDEFKTKYLN